MTIELDNARAMQMRLLRGQKVKNLAVEEVIRELIALVSRGRALGPITDEMVEAADRAYVLALAKTRRASLAICSALEAAAEAQR